MRLRKIIRNHNLHHISFVPHVGFFFLFDNDYFKCLLYYHRFACLLSTFFSRLFLATDPYTHAAFVSWLINPFVICYEQILRFS